MRSSRVKSSRRTMRMRSVTSQCTLAISDCRRRGPASRWNCSSSAPTSPHVGLAGRRTSQAAFNASSARRIGLARAQARHAIQLQQHARVVELVEAVEVDRPHGPAGLALDVEEALVAQPEQRLAHRRAADAQPRAHLVLGEAVAGQQLEVVDLRLQLRVGLLGEIGTGALGGRWKRRLKGMSTSLRGRLRRRPVPPQTRGAAAQPTMPPCATTISTTAAWNSGEKLAVQSVTRAGTRSRGRWPRASWSARTLGGDAADQQVRDAGPCRMVSQVGGVKAPLPGLSDDVARLGQLGMKSAPGSPRRQDAAHRPASPMPQAQVAAQPLRRRAVGQLRRRAPPGYGSRSSCARANSQRPGRHDRHAPARDVVAEHRAETAGLDEVALHVDDISTACGRSNGNSNGRAWITGIRRPPAAVQSAGHRWPMVGCRPAPSAHSARCGRRPSPRRDDSAQQLVEILADQQHAAPAGIARRAMRCMDLGGGEVQAEAGLATISTVGSSAQLARQHGALHVAARQRLDRRLRPRVLTRKAIEAAALRASAAGEQPGPTGRQRRRSKSAAPGSPATLAPTQALKQRFFRQAAHAEARHLRALRHGRLAVDRDVPPAIGIAARERLDQLALAVAGHAGDADDLARLARSATATAKRRPPATRRSRGEAAGEFERPVSPAGSLRTGAGPAVASVPPIIQAAHHRAWCRGPGGAPCAECRGAARSPRRRSRTPRGTCA